MPEICLESVGMKVPVSLEQPAAAVAGRRLPVGVGMPAWLAWLASAE